jgi:hypothetical protein
MSEMIIYIFLFFTANFNSAYAVQPEVTFTAYSSGIKAYYSPNMSFTRTIDIGPGDSGPRVGAVDWTYGSVPDLDPQSYLHITGSSTFDVNGNGVSKVLLKVTSLANRDFRSFPNSTVYPSGGIRWSVKIAPNSVPEQDRDFTFLAVKGTQGQASGAWMTLADYRFSSSVQKQMNLNQASTLQDSLYIDLTKVYPGVQYSDNTRGAEYSYVSIGPELCGIEDRIKDPTPSFATSASLDVLRSVVCVEFIPTSRTGDRLSWSERKSKITPRVASLQQFRANSEILNRFGSSEFRDLIVEIAEKKLRLFNQWAAQNFTLELTKQAQTLKDLSRTLDSHANPLSYRKMLETFRNSAHSLEERKALVQELKEMNHERRVLSADAQYQAFLDQVD